ncbi:MAG: mechanosensitive ion channel family protein [Saprospiraceae bacterium]
MEQFINDLWITMLSYYDSLVALLPKLLLATIAFAILFTIANRSKVVVNNKLQQRMDDPLLAKFLGRMVKIGITLFAVMVVMKILGLTDIAAGIITGASVSAIVIGFAFKDIGENLLAGIMLAFDRPFRVGDTVELNGHKGSVISLNLRTTQIKTFDGKDIYIPNANIVKNAVTNYTIDGFLRQEFNIGLDYGSNIDQAIDILKKTMSNVDGILEGDKGPTVSLGDLNSSSYNITVKYWLDTFNPKYPGYKIRTRAINESLTELDKAGFYMPGDIVELKNYQDKEMKTSTRQGDEEQKQSSSDPKG